MTIQVTAEADVIREATQILIKHMAPSKAVRFWASWYRGDGDYLTWRNAEFDGETVNSLYEAVVGHHRKVWGKLGHGLHY